MRIFLRVVAGLLLLVALRYAWVGAACIPKSHYEEECLNKSWEIEDARRAYEKGLGNIAEVLRSQAFAPLSEDRQTAVNAAKAAEELQLITQHKLNYDEQALEWSNRERGAYYARRDLLKRSFLTATGALLAAIFLFLLSRLEFRIRVVQTKNAS